MKKEEYLVQFDTQNQAKFWMERMIQKFEPEVRKVNKQSWFVEFDDAIYYFWSINRVSKLVSHATRLAPDAIYIILDDPERKRLSTYVPNGTVDLESVSKKGV